jgi:multidrug efflux pump subunit AcrA (membrane-fusion protein)
MRRSVRRQLFAAGAASLLLAAGEAASANQFRTAPVLLESVGTVSHVSGTVVPYAEVQLVAQIGGQVKFIAGKEGDTFKAGTVLVSMNDDELQARRRAAVASYLAAEARLRDEHVQYSREVWSPQAGRTTGMGLPSMFDQFMKPMTGQYAGPDNPWVRRYADLHGRARALDDAGSQRLEALARIEQIDTGIRDANLYAPFDGVIATKVVQQGATVQPGQVIVTFSHVAFLRVQAEVPIRLAGALRPGMVVPVRLDVGGGVEEQARVSQIFPIADQSRHTVTVKFDLRQGVPGGPGMYAELRLPDTAAQATRLPTVPQQGAIFQRGSLDAVMVLENGQPSLRLVRVGAPVGNGRVAILAGLNGNEQVILAEPGQFATMHSARAAPR